MVQPRLRKEQQRAADTKAAILKAAFSEFAALGFDGASTRGIATAAGVNHPLITHHFGTKEDLWKATASHVFGIYVDRMTARREALEGVDDKTMAKMLLREFILFSAEEPDFALFMTQTNQGGEERMKWLANRYLKAGSEAEIGVIRVAQQLGLLASGDSEHMRYLFIGAATSIFTYASEFRILTGKDPYSEDVIDKHVNMVLSLFNGEWQTTT